MDISSEFFNISICLYTTYVGILTGLVMTKFEKPSNARRNAVKFSERAAIMWWDLDL